MLLAILAGYSFARIKFRLRTTLLLLILGLRMLPAIVMVVPIYILIQRIGLLNTPWALIIVYSAFQAACLLRCPDRGGRHLRLPGLLE